MTRARPPAVAGLFYADDPATLRADVARHLAAGAERTGRRDPPKAIVAPHAGYIYSGDIAGSAYAPWRGLAGAVKRVVLLGPAHRVWVRGLAAPTVHAFDTPLGPTPIDRAALDAVADLPQVVFDDAVHARDHALEVQLPFIRATLGPVPVAPFLVGQASHGEVAEVIDRLWGGPETRIVISSDLSHFLDHGAATAMDRATADAIVRFDRAGLHRDSACGRIAIGGLLALAERRALTIDAVDLRTSGETAGAKDRVVGYGAFLVGAGQ